MGKTTDSALPANFPFSSSAATKFSSLNNVYNLLQSHRENCASYLDAYMTLYQPLFPIIHSRLFLSMVDEFWNDPGSVDMSSLASFLMVCALGCFAVTRDTASTAELCMAAEACLNKTPLMVYPDLSAVRTLCLMVIAKQTINTSCQNLDSCWTFLGIVVRAAMAIHLHDQPEPDDQTTEALVEWKSRQTVWISILYFCLQTSVLTGKPLLLSPDNMESKSTVFTYKTKATDNPWFVLIESYPILCQIISRVNSDAGVLSYQEVLNFNDQLRQIMITSKSIPGSSLHLTIDIFFRRIILTLHRRHALHTSASVLYPVSYWSSLECSLAILVHHRDLCEHKETSAENMEVLGRLFKVDIFSAMLTVCLYLLRQDTPLARGAAIPPRQTILETLQTCSDIWEREAQQSICFQIGHSLLVTALRIIT